MDGLTPFALLAVDQGNCSGWSLWAGMRLVESGELDFRHKDGANAMNDVVIKFAELRTHLGDAVTVFEDHSGAFRKSQKQVLGMGKSRGRWETLLSVHDLRRWHNVTPALWRRSILAVAGKNRLTRDQWKDRAQRWVHAMYQQHVGPDEAEAICIGHWGVRSPEVRSLLPKAFQ